MATDGARVMPGTRAPVQTELRRKLKKLKGVGASRPNRFRTGRRTGPLGGRHLAPGVAQFSDPEPGS